MSLMAPIAEPVELKKYSGPQRAAALMLALGKEHGGSDLGTAYPPTKIKELSATIAGWAAFRRRWSSICLSSSPAKSRRWPRCTAATRPPSGCSAGILPGDKVKEIMEDIRGPSGRTMWDKLSNVSETVLAGALKHEYPQTVAVILSKLRPDHAARVIAELPREFSVDVVMRMLRMETVQKDVINQVEQTLKSEFMTNLSRSQKRDPHEAMAELFNSLDRSTEEAMLNALDNKAPESAERIRALMFTFEDLSNLLPAAISIIVRNADKREMAMALKGAPDKLKQMFFGAMTERAAKLMREDMAAMGPVRARDCEEAQSSLVRLAKSLADRGEILLVDPKSDDAMII
jgi:flagellar motor switch protein FliG